MREHAKQEATGTPVYVRAATGAAKSDISVATWWRWVRDGHLPPPALKMPGVTLWEWAAVDRALRTRGGAA
jgi:predicted DNA-binding transcriptional regulator AlpA